VPDQPLAQLLLELFTAIKMLSGYPVPETFPEVHRVPRAQLEARLHARAGELRQLDLGRAARLPACLVSRRRCRPR
jgi:hypothetical protein